MALAHSNCDTAAWWWQLGRCNISAGLRPPVRVGYGAWSDCFNHWGSASVIRILYDCYVGTVLIGQLALNNLIHSECFTR